MPKQWQKSTTSSQDGGNSVEVTMSEAGLIEIRESDRPGEVIVTTPTKFALWIDGVKRGEFDHFGV